MSREKRIRVSEEEHATIKEVREVRYPSRLADEMALGAVVADVMEEELERQRSN